MSAVRLVARVTIAALIHMPIVVWLEPPFFASFAIGVAAYCLASTYVADFPRSAS